MSTPPHSKTHLIVGDGITALAFLQTFARNDVGEIVVLGRAASQLGRGAAYAKGDEGTPWRYAYLLNSPADDIDPAFAKWLAERWDEVRDTMAGRSPNWLAAAEPLVARGDLYGVNAPREFYGDFMEAAADAAIAELTSRGIQVRLVDDEALSIDVAEDGVRVLTARGTVFDAVSADIAPGGPSTMRFDGDDSAFSAPSVFGYEDRIAEHIKRGAEIFCVGGNAAMLDVLRLCQSLIPEEKLRFVACAPDGEIPAALVPRLPRKLTKPTFSKGHATADSFLAEVWREISGAKGNGDEMREIRAGFRAHFLDHPLETYVSNPEEARKVAGKLRFWLRGGTRDTIFDMHRLCEAGLARMEKGLVRSIEATETGAIVHITDSDGTETAMETGFVVNCAGAGPNSSFDPVTEDLLGKGLLTRCAQTRGLKVGPGCALGAGQIRYLSPAVSQIGEEVVAMPLYDAHMLRTYVARANG